MNFKVKVLDSVPPGHRNLGEMCLCTAGKAKQGLITEFPQSKMYKENRVKFILGVTQGNGFVFGFPSAPVCLRMVG